MTVFSGGFANGTGIAVLPSDDDKGDSAPAALPEDARLYLRHVENGESIRSLAREAGCHASTILRRIRRFEARRDDPLVDRALSVKAKAAPADDRQVLRVLRRLAEPGAILATRPRRCPRRS